MRKTIAQFLLLAFGLALYLPQVQAASAATLSLTVMTGDTVQVHVTGDANYTVQFYFLPPGGLTTTSLVFGQTDANGNFTTSISSGGYGIPAGSFVYVAVNGRLSTTMLWPTYSSSLTLSQTDVQVAVGQTLTVNGSSALILAANSLPSSIGTALNGSQLTITGLTTGIGNLTLCAANVGCANLAVNVGGQGQTQISFDQNNLTLNLSQSKNINIFGGSVNGFVISSNSNPSVAYASISGHSNIISLYGQQTGTASIVVCSVESSANCATLNLTVLSSSASQLSFSQNNLSLIPGMQQSVTISGGPDNNYYVFANSNSGVATANLSGTTLNVTGGSNSGSNIITVCSSSQNSICGSVNINNVASTTPSATVLSFSQNVVSIAQGDTTNVTVSGGLGGGYLIAGNTNPSSVTATINGSSNIISIYGQASGTAQVNVCSTSVSTTCANLYVNVGAALSPITFSPANANLTPGQTMTVFITGGNSVDKNITANTNANVASASLNNGSSAMFLVGGQTAGQTSITVCSTTFTTNCGILTVSLTAPITPPIITPAPPVINPSVTPPPPSPTDQIQRITLEAGNITTGANIVKNNVLANQIMTAYTAPITANVSDYGADATTNLNNFIAYGTPTTMILGAGERAGVVGSYKQAFGKLPTTADDWTDVIKIANGRWPSANSAAALQSGKNEFAKVYNRQPDLTNPHDNAAVSIIAYGLRPTARNTNSEKTAILTFRSVYRHNPVSALAWDVVRAIAYSGAKR